MKLRARWPWIRNSRTRVSSTRSSPRTKIRRVPYRFCSALIADGKDGYAVEMLLAQTLGSNDEAAAKRALEAATRARPFAGFALLRLGGFGREIRGFPAELSALRALGALEQHEPKVYQRLLRRLNESGAYAEAAEVGEAAVFADVSGSTTHLLFAEALARTGKRERAEFELESATLCEGHARRTGRGARATGRAVRGERQACSGEKGSRTPRVSSIRRMPGSPSCRADGSSLALLVLLAT